MRICVENGMFTVSFIKEGLQKVRGFVLNPDPRSPRPDPPSLRASQFRDWIDDLLVTSWTACQGTDLIIESPSAMGGLHIAEGLAVPYFRAFTMPWTRTRAYPVRPSALSSTYYQFGRLTSLLSIVQHAFAVPESHRGGSYNFMTYTMVRSELASHHNGLVLTISRRCSRSSIKSSGGPSLVRSIAGERRPSALPRRR